MANDYDFTGIGAGDESADFDSSQSIEQHSCPEPPSSLESLQREEDDEASRAIRSECNGCAGYQGGTSKDNRMGELEADCQPGTMPRDMQAGQPGQQDLYWGDDYQRREWNPEDNVSPNDDLDEFGIIRSH